MRVYASIIAFLTLSLVQAHAQSFQPTTQTYVCPQCGKIHARASVQSSTLPTQVATTVDRIPTIVTTRKPPVSNTASISAPNFESGTSNVLGMLNAQRARQGIASLRYDPQLQAVAERRVRQMAASSLKDHPPGSIAPGTHEGVGWSSSYSPSGVSACYTSDTRMRYAGAAMATGRDGVYFAVVYR